MKCFDPAAKKAKKTFAKLDFSNATNVLSSFNKELELIIKCDRDGFNNDLPLIMDSKLPLRIRKTGKITVPLTIKAVEQNDDSFDDLPFNLIF